jgi:hypothetical protein
MNEDGRCTACGKAIAGSFAFLEGGALFMVGSGSSEMKDEMEGFLSIGYHGSGGEKSATKNIVENGKCGQFELAFCSVGCLKEFLGRCVDELENERQSG